MRETIDGNNLMTSHAVTMLLACVLPLMQLVKKLHEVMHPDKPPLLILCRFVKFYVFGQHKIICQQNLHYEKMCLHVSFLGSIVNVNGLCYNSFKARWRFRCCWPTLSARTPISRTTTWWLSFKKVSKTHSYNWYQPPSFYCIARQSACTCRRISSAT